MNSTAGQRTHARGASNDATSPRVLVIDDHALLADGLCLELQGLGFSTQVIGGPTGEAILTFAADWAPDVVLLDMHLGDDVGSGLDLVRHLSDHAGAVIVLTGSKDPLLLAACVEAGAVGILKKTSSLAHVCETVERAACGERLLPMPLREQMLDDLRSSRRVERSSDELFHRMTPRERDVLGHLMNGSTAQEIASMSFVSLATVRTQIRSILQKLGVTSQVAAVAMAYQHGWDRHVPRTSAACA